MSPEIVMMFATCLINIYISAIHNAKGNVLEVFTVWCILLNMDLWNIMHFGTAQLQHAHWT